MSHAVLVVEDDPAFRAAVTEALEGAEDLRLVGVADDLPEGLRLLALTAPDVLLVDIGLPSGSGIELIRRAEESLPQCHSMVVTVFADDRVVTQCIEAGAVGYLLKDARGMDVVESIRQLCAGGSPISPAIARRLLKRFGAPTADPQATDAPAADAQRALLSSQERHVLQLSAKGYSYEEIASLLKLSRHTVETYVKRIYRKLQVHTKTEAVYEARKMGLVDD
ncbi:response regulator transcription factor [Variovorax sp. HJSM1_2]|uniref:response regulator transcription factor n=1 Tax=Variovorax sp. HJSM1_2 TaxID=3366263 RepID=UPI003BCFE139